MSSHIDTHTISHLVHILFCLTMYILSTFADSLLLNLVQGKCLYHQTTSAHQSTAEDARETAPKRMSHEAISHFNLIMNAISYVPKDVRNALRNYLFLGEHIETKSLMPLLIL